MAERFLALPSVHFFLVLSVSRPELPLGQLSSSAISQLFSSYPPSGKFCTVSEYPDKKIMAGGERLIWSNLGLNPSWMDARTFARIKNLIWDQVLATIKG